MSTFDHFHPEDGDDFVDFHEDQGDQIDRAMDTKDEQDMLAACENCGGEDFHHTVECYLGQDSDPEADAADALDREADEMFLAYQADTRRTRLVEEVDQSLAYDKGDPKREHALGWSE